MNGNSHLKLLIFSIDLILSMIIYYWLFQRKLDCEYQILLSREVGGGDEWEQPFDIINYFYRLNIFQILSTTIYY